MHISSDVHKFTCVDTKTTCPSQMYVLLMSVQNVQYRLAYGSPNIKVDNHRTRIDIHIYIYIYISKYDI